MEIVLGHPNAALAVDRPGRWDCSCAADRRARPPARPACRWRGRSLPVGAEHLDLVRGAAIADVEVPWPRRARRAAGLPDRRRSRPADSAAGPSVRSPRAHAKRRSFVPLRTSKRPAGSNARPRGLSTGACPRSCRRPRRPAATRSAAQANRPARRRGPRCRRARTGGRRRRSRRAARACPGLRPSARPRIVAELVLQHRLILQRAGLGRQPQLAFPDRPDIGQVVGHGASRPSRRPASGRRSRCRRPSPGRRPSAVFADPLQARARLRRRTLP